MPNPEQLSSFVEWFNRCITGDEKGQAQIFLDRLFQGFGLQGSLDVGGAPEFRVLKSAKDGGGTSFADYVWKPVVLIEMKKRGENLQKHYRQAFDYWTRLVPNRPRYVVLCNFDEFWIYDFDTFPWPQFEMGSATVPVAESGVAPDSRSTKISSVKNQTNEVFGATPKTTGETPVLPKTTLAKIEAVAAAGREVRRVRAEALPKMKGGLRALYRTLELPGANPLKDAHVALDTAVLTAYGFSPKKDLLAQLLTLNQQVAERIERGEPVTAPGVPKNYPEPKRLVTEDCVKPPVDLESQSFSSRAYPKSTLTK